MGAGLELNSFFYRGLVNSPRIGDYLTMIRRNIQDSVRRAMADTPVVLLNGARQTGKTTLAQAMAARSGAQYFTLDDAATLALAAGDPAGFIRNLTGPVVLGCWESGEKNLGGPVTMRALGVPLVDHAQHFVHEAGLVPVIGGHLDGRDLELHEGSPGLAVDAATIRLAAPGSQA